ncbi:hypothetical protein [Paenibacillus wynnii]|uniref:hypothetical protein n=1 Tax=Paenibacillus wynnii TaxID=268407 RepID=UPI002791B723|nr:hypothetical protein [Paenibacillus wynnii]MDQ0193622.1 hypothetical protein [Paenibacillus wynnii]
MDRKGENHKRKIGISVAALVVLGIAAVFILLQINKGARPSIEASKRGLWKSEAYDYIIETDNKDVVLNNYTKDSLLPFAYGRMDKDGTYTSIKFMATPRCRWVIFRMAR